MYINNYIFIHVLIIALRHYSEKNNTRAEKELVYFEYVNIGFAAHRRITFAEKHFDWCNEVNKYTYCNAPKNLQQYVVNTIYKKKPH